MPWVGLIALVSVYVIGGCHGLALAWAQPARMRWWARMVDLSTDRVMVLRAEMALEAYERVHGPVVPMPDPTPIADPVGDVAA